MHTATTAAPHTGQHPGDRPGAAELCATFPWLDLSPAERDDLAARELSGLDRLAVSIARRAIEQESTTPVDRLVPTLPPTFDLVTLDWPSRHHNILRRHGLETAADLASITISDLLATWSVNTRITEAILARLFRTVLADDPQG
ncbi:hypothetical protein ACO229_06720 [Promicromonospora sp. MS192]|uniref:hypothetical protein n=1 Tax=Promicromonospora sp. MS192 TaxID=3412684 RepID=UPI003C2B2C0D